MKSSQDDATHHSPAAGAKHAEANAAKTGLHGTQHATPTFAPVSPTGDKDVHQVGRVKPQTGHSPAGSLTLAAAGEPEPRHPRST